MPAWSDGLTTADLTRIAALRAEHDVSWPGHTGQGYASTIYATSCADLVTKFNALPVADLTQWHHIILDSTQAASAWSAAVTLRGSLQTTQTVGHLFGGTRDWATAGGGVVIESSNPASPVFFTGKVTIAGCRGLHFLSVGGAYPAATPDGTGRDGAQNFVVSRSSTYPDAGVVRLERCKIGVGHDGVTDKTFFGVGIIQTGAAEQVDIIDCDFNGCQTAIALNGVRRSCQHGNDFQQIIGDAMDCFCTTLLSNVNSDWTDNNSKLWYRFNTVRNMVNDARFWFEHSDGAQHGTSGDLGGYDALHEFDCFYAERIMYADVGTIEFSANPAAGSSITIGGVVWSFVAALTTGNQILIGANIDATVIAAADALNASGDAAMTKATYRADASNDALNVVMKNENAMVLSLARSTSPASNATINPYIRYTAGTQGQYNDDNLVAYINVFSHNCISANTAGNSATYQAGQVDHVRCTAARTGTTPPDATPGTNGFAFNNDFSNHIRVGHLETNPSLTFKQSIRNSVAEYILDRHAADVFRDPEVDVDAGFIKIAGNRRVMFSKNGVAGKRPADLMAGTFTTDSYGRVAYSGVLANGSNSRAAFRAQVHAQLKLANATDALTIGASDPALWGAAILPTLGTATRGFLRRLRIRA